MKKQGKKSKPITPSEAPSSSIKEDSRFDSIYSDPRFIKVPQKQKKLEIDDRFKSVLTSKKFNQISKVDKYGRKISKEDTTMKNYYKLAESNQSGEEEGDGQK
jgi:hypothetical protein